MLPPAGLYPDICASMRGLTDLYVGSAVFDGVEEERFREPVPASRAASTFRESSDPVADSSDTCDHRRLLRMSRNGEEQLVVRGAVCSPLHCSRSLMIFTLPPPGWCRRLSWSTFALAFHWRGLLTGGMLCCRCQRRG